MHTFAREVGQQGPRETMHEIDEASDTPLYFSFAVSTCRSSLSQYLT